VLTLQPAACPSLKRKTRPEPTSCATGSGRSRSSTGACSTLMAHLLLMASGEAIDWRRAKGDKRSRHLLSSPAFDCPRLRPRFYSRMSGRRESVRRARLATRPGWLGPPEATFTLSLWTRGQVRPFVVGRGFLERAELLGEAALTAADRRCRFRGPTDGRPSSSGYSRWFHGGELHREQGDRRPWPQLSLASGAANLRKEAHFARSALGSADALVLQGEHVALRISRSASRARRLTHAS